MYIILFRHKLYFECSDNLCTYTLISYNKYYSRNAKEFLTYLPYLLCIVGDVFVESLKFFPSDVCLAHFRGDTIGIHEDLSQQKMESGTMRRCLRETRLVVLIEHRLVTYRMTDRLTYNYSI